MKALREIVSLAVFVILFLTGHSAAQTFTFTYTGDVQTFVVPPGVTLLHVDAFGAQGGNPPGGGFLG
jgi:hypothetical protein